MASVPTETSPSAAEHPCHACSESSAESKRCSGCGKVWYCNRECQESDWVRHIFHCNPKRPINTADHLALAVRKDMIPQDPQTREDYGFTRTQPGTTDDNMLGGLYCGLMQYMKPPWKAQQMHRWRVRGELVARIKAAYEQRPVGQRGGYYPWFLLNQHVLDPTHPSIHDAQVVLDELQLRAWKRIGLPPTSARDVESTVEGWPEHKRTCFRFVALIWGGLHPGPDADFYIPFGFCACPSLHDEMALARVYTILLDNCTFTELCDAFRDRTAFVQLFRSRGLERSHGLWSGLPPGFEDIVTETGGRLPVWGLKQYALAEGPVGAPSLAVQWDYGFTLNARSEEDTALLRKTYRLYFLSRGADALQLHEACMAGRVYEHIDGVMPLKCDKLRRLMKNVYPLAAPPEEEE